MASETFDVQSELSRRHKAASRTIAGLIVAAILVSIVSYLGGDYFRQQPNQPLEVGLMLIILFLGLGSIVWRRTKFAAMRLQDIGALEGPKGLLQTLEKTTMQLALFGAAIATIGFLATLVTGNQGHTYRGTAISLVVLLYSYPTRSSWSKVVKYFSENANPVDSPTAEA